VDGVAAQIEFICRLAAHRPQEGRRDQRGERPKVLALDCVEECRIHFVEGGVRLVTVFEDDLHLGISDLQGLGAPGRRLEKDCRGKKTTLKISCRRVQAESPTETMG
jgi:hypothetical protein